MRIASRLTAIVAVGVGLLAGLLACEMAGAADNEILVKFGAGVHPATARALRAANRARLEGVIPRIGTQVLRLPSAADAERALARLRAHPAVAYAEPNGRVHALAIPNDYYFNAIFEEFLTGWLIDAQWPLWQMQMDQAWDVATGDPDTIVAVIDTGTDLTHPDLAGMSVGTVNIIAPAGTPSQDDFGHGTAMAGCAVANTNNTEGVAGASWGCRLLSIKCLDSAGEGEFDDCATGIIAAADWAGPGVVRVINMSWGDYFPSQTLQDAIDYAYGKGIVCVAAMGNVRYPGDDKTQLIWPAAANNVIAVGGTDIIGGLSPTSYVGPHASVVAPCGDDYIGVLAPIPTYSTYISDMFDYDVTPYSLFDFTDIGMGVWLPLPGTSFSTAHVSGVAALMVSHTPTLTPAEVEVILELTATDIGVPGWDEETGWGRVDAGAALAWEGPVFGSVEGMVTDDISGQPVEAATLTASAPPREATGESGADGTYAIGDLVAGTWTLTVSAPGYITQEQTISITAGAVTNLDIVLERMVGDLAGTVLSVTTGLPVVGATVTLTQVGDGGGGVTTTGDDGTYSFLNVPVGDYQVTVDAAGYIPQTKTATVAYHQTTTVDFALIRKTGTISGVVTDSVTGEPIWQAWVVAAQSGGGGSGAAFTDESGAYSIPGLPTGIYVMTAMMEGYSSSQKSGVEVTWGGNTRVDFQLDPLLTQVSQTFAAGWNLISLPIVPADADPPAVFGSLPISGRLYRYEPAIKGYVGYCDFDPDPFGEMKCGEGYWLYCDAVATVVYEGFRNHEAQSIALAGGGWSLIGHPFQTATPLADCQVRRVADGLVKGFAEAVGDGWIHQPAYTWGPVIRGYQTIGLEVPFYEDDHLRPWMGYWFITGSNAVELIVPVP